MKFIIKDKPQSSFFKKNNHIHEIAASLLWQRGVRAKKDIDEFLNPTYAQEINGSKKYDPFKFKEMEKVVKRILDAARKKERVVVYGDYDADGVCGGRPGAAHPAQHDEPQLYGLRADHRHPAAGYRMDEQPRR